MRYLSILTFLVMNAAVSHLCQAGIIADLTATSSKGTFSSYNINNLTNGVGLSPSVTTDATHSAYFGDMWLNNHGRSNGSLTFNLGSTYTLTSIAIWQYDTEGSLDRGVKDFELEYSTDGTNFSVLQQNLVLLNTTPTNAGGTGESQIFDISGTTASHIRLNYLTNYGDANLTGLAEVQFVATAAVPEPSTAIAMGLLGVLGVAGTRRRGRQVSVA